jgi:predicted N-acyltransferase
MHLSCETQTGLAIGIDVYRTVMDLPERDWNTLSDKTDVYFSIPYLRALEKGLEKGIQFRYVIAYGENKKVLAKFYFQLITVGTAQINPDAVIRKIGNVLPGWLAKSLEAKVSICGNAFCSGEHGMRFNESLQVDEQHDLLNEVLMHLKGVEKELNQKRISISLLKEFWPDSFTRMAQLESKGFHEGMFDSNMILRMQPEWKTFKDYLNCMKAKYRTKANRALELSKDLVVRDLTAEDMEDCQEKLDELYMSMVRQAEFSFAHLNALTFLELKRALGDRLYFRTYSIDGVLVGFAMATFLDNILDGNFIGLDYEYNKKHAIYQRILYDFVEIGIEKRVCEIRIGRTAEEIKSGIGAEPVPMKLYARHRNNVSNQILKRLVQNVKPSDFRQLKPFKAEYYQ